MPTVIELKQKAKELRKLADTLESAALGLEKLGFQETNSENGVSKRPGKPNTLDICYDILSEASAPLKKEEIIKKAADRGVTVKSGTIQSYLSKDPRFKNVSRGLWSLE